MKHIKYIIEFVFVKMVEWILRLPPYNWSVRLGECLGTLLGKILAKRSQLVLRNLRDSFPEMGENQIQDIASRFWRNLGRVAIEFVRINDVVPAHIDPNKDVKNMDVLQSALAQNKGLILTAGHFCNWEAAGVMIHRLLKSIEVPFTAIARPMKNPLVEKWVQSRRSDGGIPIILHRQAVKSSLKILRKKEVIGILIDQNLYTGGVFVDFFGRSAATTPLPALLHSRTDAPVLLTYTERVGNKFQLVFEKINLDSVGEKDQLHKWTRSVNEKLEEVIKKQPGWWFWIHNRWKRKAEASV